MNLEIGSTVGDYQIVGILGAGGMGKVYKVRNVISDRVEAMKVLLPDLANAPELADRFLREIKVQASLEHPNIAALHTALRVENQLLMLMEFVEGVTLEQKLKEGPLPVPLAVDYIRQVLAALEYAHLQGVIHRDIKPANMMLTSGGVVKLMDFGIAKASSDHRLTITGTTMGSLYYMSPEQIQGASNLDARADLYSVGVSLYELVTGKRPFDGDSQFAIMSAHLEKTPVPPITLDPGLPQSLNDLILMSVAKDPNARFQAAGAFRNALGNVVPPVIAPVQAPAATVTAPAPAPAPGNFHVIEPTRPAPAGSKRGLWMALGAVAAIAAVVAVIQFAPWKGKAAPQVMSTSPAPVAPPAAALAPQPEQAAQPSATPLQTPAQPPVQQAAPPVQASRLPTQAPPFRMASPPAESQSHAPAQQAIQQPAAQPPAMQSPPAQSSAQVPPQQAAPAGPSRAELQEVREKLMMVNTRAAGVRTSLQTLQRSQAASGLNLRGDMQEAAGMMNSYLEGANAALQAGDVAAAKSFIEKGERQLERLEKFLNR
jgi:serine/threonine protein kinase